MRFDDNKKYMIIPNKYDFCYFLSEVREFENYICVKYQGEWIGLVEKDGILQPENAEKGDKYLVWLRSTSGTALLEDVKFFISDYEYTPEYKNEDKVIVEVVKTPVTYDSIALFIVLAGIIIAIVVVAILRKKSNKENK